MNSARLSEALGETFTLFERAGEPRTTSEIADELDLGRRAAYARLNRLVEEGYIETKSVGASARVWWRPPDSFDDSTGRHGDGQNTRQELQYTKQILETAPIGVITVEPDGAFATANQQAVELLELEEEINGDEFVGINKMYDEDETFVPPEERPYIRAFETRESVRDWRTKLESATGNTRWLSVNVEPMTGEDGAVEQVLVTFKDISQLTEQTKRLERQRNDLEAELEELFERVDDGFYALDDKWHFTYVNDQAEKLLDSTRAELVGRNIWEAFEWAAGSRIRTEYERAMETQEQTTFEVYYPDSLEAWYEINAYPSETGLSVYFRDVTDRKETEETLRKSEERLQLALDAGDLGAWELDLKTEKSPIRTFQHDRIFGYEEPLEDWSFERFLEHVHPDDRGHVRQTFEEAFETGELVFICRISRVDGGQRWISVRGEFHTEDGGEPVRGVGTVQDITERRQRKQELRQQRAELATLNNLNTIVSEITETVLGKSTREEVEQAACDALAASDSYEFAWLAGINSQSETFEPRATAGTDAYVEEITVSLDPNDPTSEGPGSTAIREGKTQVVQDVFSDPYYKPRRDAATEYGFSSLAAIPVIHEETVYGVLGVYADRTNAFDTAERAVISRLGEVLGHAIASIERKRALMSEEVVELTFQIRDVFEAFDIPARDDGTITVEKLVPLQDEEFLLYGTVTADARESMEQVTEALDRWKVLTFHDDEGDTTYELQIADHTILSTLASMGGYLEDAVIEDADYRLTVHLAPSADIRQFIDTLQEHYPTVEMVTRNQTTRTNERSGTNDVVQALTERQRMTLEAAYYSGFFEWPRDSSGESVADSIGVAPPTFHYHLRNAEKKVIEAALAVEAE